MGPNTNCSQYISLTKEGAGGTEVQRGAQPSSEVCLLSGVTIWDH